MYLAGSTLLQTVDSFALNNHNTSHPVTSDNIGIIMCTNGDYNALVNLIPHYPPSWADKRIDGRPFSQGGAFDTAPFDVCWLKSGL